MLAMQMAAPNPPHGSTPATGLRHDARAGPSDVDSGIELAGEVGDGSSRTPALIDQDDLVNEGGTRPWREAPVQIRSGNVQLRACAAKASVCGRRQVLRPDELKDRCRRHRAVFTRRAPRWRARRLRSSASAKHDHVSRGAGRCLVTGSKINRSPNDPGAAGTARARATTASIRKNLNCAVISGRAEPMCRTT
jgi:hypothetical protein